MSEGEALRGEVLDVLAADPLPGPSEALRARARDVARWLARCSGAGELPSGALVDGYRVIGVLGRGGQGTVYRAEDQAGRQVALKVTRPELTARLVREAQILFHLDHPRIVRIERAAMDLDPPYIACELLGGGTLAERLQAGPLPEREVIALAEAILEALAHGHARGVVHRDLKPSNVLFDAEGGVKVADFGIGSLRLVEELGLGHTLASLDATLGVGTPIYMAPEQDDPSLRVDGKVDGRADLYALGKLLFEALTGRSPRTVRPVSSLVPGLAPGWDAFLFRLLEDRPQDRFESAEAARAALRRLRQGASPEPAARAPEAARSTRAGGALLGLALGLGATWVAAPSGAGPGGLPVPLIAALVGALLGLLAGSALDAVRAARGRRVGPSRAGIAELAGALGRLARARTGALIAVERRDSLEENVATGTPLDARVDGDLVRSLFQPGSPFHDGAVVVRGDRIVAAGCFLPLTDRRDVPFSLGTRHRAALGLSDETDALVLVVSEETGQISLAEGGRLERDLTPRQVAERLAGAARG